MIELGLARISRLVQASSLPWRAIHVAGTNGKGSICAYASSMLHSNGIRSGLFTSPHLVNRWDCIRVNESTVSEAAFREAEAEVSARNIQHGIGASEFELLTATAFELFTAARIQVAVVEVGMGGRLDATNVLQNPLVTVIAKIGLDHQGILGHTLEEIALQKAGILKPGAPCVVDASNDSGVLEVINQHAKGVGASSMLPTTAESLQNLPEMPSSHHPSNVACAIVAIQEACSRLGLPKPSIHQLAGVAQNVVWPGRLQMLSMKGLLSRKESVLIDGAHNEQSAEALAAHVETLGLRGNAKPITWVMAFSAGKDIRSMLEKLLRPGDNLSVVQFGPVDGMPWVSPAQTRDALEAASNIVSLKSQYDAGSDVLGALKWAHDIAGSSHLVVAGSLYLVGDVMRLIQNSHDG